MEVAAKKKTEIQQKVERIFNLQKANQQKVADSTTSERRKKLYRLQQAILEYRKELKDAIHRDFRKHGAEVDMVEIYPIISEIKHARSHLAQWMRPKSVATPIVLFGTNSYINYEPKGVVLIISPWNFPINLTFAPLVSAIAAGNCVMIKPSEHTPNTSAVMKKIVDKTFDEAEVALVEGEVDVATALLKQPFNHIFFTGSPQVGKIVMAAAAKHLTSVTLELGGKSPTIIDETANLSAAANRIALAKWVNNGQICLSPDYIFVHEKVKDLFLEKLKMATTKFYGKNAANSESYARMVNQNHFQRVKEMIEDALSKGGKIVFGSTSDDSQKYLEPTIITDVPEDARLMQEEIFGPVLPVLTYSNLNEAIQKINDKEKPLGLYIYSKSKKNIKKIINNTRAGGTCINQSGVHFYNHNLPFGGVNNSGIGKGHGFYGFESFSNARGVLKQWSPLTSLDLILPPYNKLKQKLIDFTIKWL